MRRETEAAMDDWLAALEAVDAKPTGAGDPGLSREELAEKLNCGTTTAHKRLKALARQGRLIVGRRRDVSPVTGRVVPVTVYRIKPPARRTRRPAAG